MRRSMVLRSKLVLIAMITGSVSIITGVASAEAVPITATVDGPVVLALEDDGPEDPGDPGEKTWD